LSGDYKLNYLKYPGLILMKKYIIILLLFLLDCAAVHAQDFNFAIELPVNQQPSPLKIRTTLESSIISNAVLQSGIKTRQ